MREDPLQINAVTEQPLRNKSPNETMLFIPTNSQLRMRPKRGQREHNNGCIVAAEANENSHVRRKKHLN